ncbi:MAG: substrate-binding domain-containing protein [Phycisphaerae bacterium]
MAQKIRNILLLLDTSTFYGRQIARGVAWYSEGHTPMAFYIHPAMGDEALQGLRNWRVDGIIGRLRQGQLPTAVGTGQLPAVTTTGHNPAENLPRITLDDEAIGRMVAEHFLQRGFRNFGFCGTYGMGFSQMRQKGFAARLAEDDYPCDNYQPLANAVGDSYFQDEQEHIVEWIRSLPHPAGVMAADDSMSWKISQACRTSQIRMPEQIALVGVNNDDMLCRLASPPTSSVALPLERLGYLAGQMLDTLLQGEQPDPPVQALPPIGVVTRRSSDVVAVEDSDISTAMRYIRDHLDENIQVDDIAAAAAVSRRSLQRKFPQVVGHTLQKEIRQVRISKAKNLLAQTDLPLYQIASACGFRYPEHLSRIFKQVTGATPTDYRRKYHV